MESANKFDFDFVALDILGDKAVRLDFEDKSKEGDWSCLAFIFLDFLIFSRSFEAADVGVLVFRCFIEFTVEEGFGAGGAPLEEEGAEVEEAEEEEGGEVKRKGGEEIGEDDTFGV